MKNLSENEVLTEEEMFRKKIQEDDTFELSKRLAKHIIDYESTYGENIRLKPSRFEYLKEASIIRNFLKDEKVRNKIEKRLFEDFQKYGRNYGFNPNTINYLKSIFKLGQDLHEYNIEQNNLLMENDELKENKARYKIGIYKTKEDWEQGKPFQYDKCNNLDDAKYILDCLMKYKKNNSYYLGFILDQKTGIEEYSCYSNEHQEDEEFKIKIKTQYTISEAEWKKLPKDYKEIINGIPHQLKLTKDGTCLVPVIIIEDTKVFETKEIINKKFIEDEEEEEL